MKDGHGGVTVGSESPAARAMSLPKTAAWTALSGHCYPHQEQRMRGGLLKTSLSAT